MRYEPGVCPACSEPITGCHLAEHYDAVRTLTEPPSRYVSHRPLVLEPCGHLYDGRLTLH